MADRIKLTSSEIELLRLLRDTAAGYRDFEEPVPPGPWDRLEQEGYVVRDIPKPGRVRFTLTSEGLVTLGDAEGEGAMS
jgi:hypothetical protein